MITYFDVILRFAIAMLIGTVIGVQRERSRHPAGIRTHMLVALSACIVMTTGQLIMLTQRQYGGGFDPMRLGCQIIPGIGFLGTGTIIHERGSIKGVTSAASLWVTACIGLCAGAGYYGAAILGTALVLLILSALKLLHTRHRSAPHSVALIKLQTADADAAAALIRRLALRHNGETARLARTADDDELTDDGMTMLVASLTFSGTTREYDLEQFAYDLSTRLSSSHLEIGMIRE